MASNKDAELLRFIAREEPLTATLEAFPHQTREKLAQAARARRRAARGLARGGGLRGCRADAASLPRLRVYSDGAARGNPGPAGAGAVLVEPTGQVVDRLGKFLGVQTNNFAEYIGLLIGLRRARELGVREVEVFADSELMIRQLGGRYQVKSPSLRPALRRGAEAAQRLLPGEARPRAARHERGRGRDEQPGHRRAALERTPSRIPVRNSGFTAQGLMMQSDMKTSSALLAAALAVQLVACGSADRGGGSNGGRKRVFVTRTWFTGNLGGLAGADAKCAEAAAAAGLGSVWKAYVSVTGTSAFDRLDDVAPWVVNGSGVMAFATKAQLKDLPTNPLRGDEFGNEFRTDAWTGTLEDGTAADANCSDWTSERGDGGRGTNIYTRWSYDGASSCASQMSLFCFEQ